MLLQININKYLIILLSISVWFQMWAINIGNAGISISMIILFTMALFNWEKLKVDLNLFLTCFIIINWMILSSWLNVPYEIWISRIGKITLLLLMLLISNAIFRFNYNLDIFFTALDKVVIIGCIYGLYQFIAPNYNLPYFLNIFSTNVTFHPKDLYDYYAGWVDFYRSYGVFAEPSFYSVFLAIYSLRLLFFYSGSLKSKISIWILFGLNIILAFSRAGYAIIGIIIFTYIISQIVFNDKNSNILRRSVNIILGFVLISLPLFMPLIMEYLNQNVFEDLSSSGRALSQGYYLMQSIKDPHILGFGVGSIKANMLESAVMGEIEAYAHNGVVSLIYEMGIIVVLVYYAIMFYWLLSWKNSKFALCFVGAIAGMLCFGDYYYIESHLLLLSCLAQYGIIKRGRVRRYEQ